MAKPGPAKSGKAHRAEGWVRKRRWERSGGWRRNALKARHCKRRDLCEPASSRHGTGVRAPIVAVKPGNAGGAKGGRKVEMDRSERRNTRGTKCRMARRHRRGRGSRKELARTVAQRDTDADGLREGGRIEQRRTPVQYTRHRMEACTILCAGPSVPSRERPPTGEPDAGDPHVRFGGRGRRQPLPAPIGKTPDRICSVARRPS